MQSFKKSLKLSSKREMKDEVFLKVGNRELPAATTGGAFSSWVWVPGAEPL